jgi:glycosyltransferase involved in cell wall biosynthesis
MCVKNEANRYLRAVLEEVKFYIDEAVFIDDASTDNTVEVIKEILCDIPVYIVSNSFSKFSNEISLRTQQWNETISHNPDWILILDADEIFEVRMRYEIQKLTAQNHTDIWCFRLYDFWNMNQYRDDQLWAAHNYYRPFLIRYKKDFKYIWHETPQHCGRMPKNLQALPFAFSSMRLKHFGWAKEEDRIIKYNRYKQLDPGAKYGCQAQYDSILDTHPNLVPWVE